MGGAPRFNTLPGVITKDEFKQGWGFISVDEFEALPPAAREAPDAAVAKFAQAIKEVYDRRSVDKSKAEDNARYLPRRSATR